MKGWLLVDPDGHAEDEDLRRWVDRGAWPMPPRCHPRNHASIGGRQGGAVGKADRTSRGGGYRPVVRAAQRVIDGLAGGLGLGDLVIELGELAPSEPLPVIERDGA